MYTTELFKIFQGLATFVQDLDNFFKKFTCTLNYSSWHRLMKCAVMKISQTVLSLVVFLVLTSDENGLASTIKGKKCYRFTLIYFGTKRTVASITLQSYLFVCFRLNSVHWFKIVRCHIRVYTFGKELNEIDDFHSPWEIWIDQSGFSRREKLYCPDVNVS